MKAAQIAAAVEVLNFHAEFGIGADTGLTARAARGVDAGLGGAKAGVSVDGARDGVVECKSRKALSLLGLRIYRRKNGRLQKGRVAW